MFTHTSTQRDHTSLASWLLVSVFSNSVQVSSRFVLVSFRAIKQQSVKKCVRNWKQNAGRESFSQDRLLSHCLHPSWSSPHDMMVIVLLFCTHAIKCYHQLQCCFPLRDVSIKSVHSPHLHCDKKNIWLPKPY